MKRMLACVAVMACVASAHAVVQVFFTNSADGYGLTNAALAFDPTQGAGTDAASYQVTSFPPLDAWGDVPWVSPSVGQFAYIWARFSEEPNNRRIVGLHLNLDDVPAEVAYYIVDDLNGNNGAKRWDGDFTQPNAPEFKQDPQILAAVQADGIQNRSTAIQNWNLYDNITRTALLGAVRWNYDGYYSAQLGPLGLAFANDPTPGVAVFGTVAWDIPEPTTLMMLGLVGLLVRRR